MARSLARTKARTKARATVGGLALMLVVAGVTGLRGEPGIAVATAAGGSTAAPRPAGADTLTAEQRRAIDEFVASAMEELELVPGMSVAVVRGDAIVYENGFGWASIERREPVTPETIFYTASLSKAQTGMAAAVLAVEGRLDLDASVTRWFEGLHFPTALAPAESTTVRDLLNHTPRFLNSGVNFYPTFVGRYAEEDLVRVLNGYSSPNDGFQYSNMSYALVSEILERAGGRPWQDVIAETVFEPVGMSSSTAYASHVPIRGVATPYTRTTGGFLARPPLKTDRKITGAGGFFSSARDLARYVIANLNDGRIDGRQALPAAAVRETRRPQSEVDARFFEFDRRAYGLGLYVADYDGDTLVHHFGGIAGGFRSHMSFMPEHGLGVVVLQNEADTGSNLSDVVATYVYDLLLRRADYAGRTRRRLDSLAADAPRRIQAATSLAARADSVAAARHTPALHLGAYVGAYENDRIGRVRVRPGTDGLRVDWGEIDAPMISLGGDDFLVEWQPGYPHATWRFAVEGDEVTGFDWGGRPFPRIRP